MDCMDENEKGATRSPFTRENFLRDLKRVADAKRPSDEKEKRPAQSESKKP